LHAVRSILSARAAAVLVLGDLQGSPLAGKFSQRFQSG
jgi:hypothetical protein